MKQTLFRTFLVLVLMTSTLVLPGRTLAAAPDAEDIMKKADAHRYDADDSKFSISLVMKEKGGDTRTRKLSMQSRKSGRDKKILIHFLEPSDVRGVGFMVWQYPKKDDERWLYIPSLHMVKRIAANDKRSSFMGTDFTYEDISGREVEEDKHEYVKSEKLKGEDCYVIKSTPRDTGSAEFAYRLSWVRKDNYFTVQEQYFDKKEKLIKIYTVDELEKVQGLWTIKRMTMKNVQTDHSTAVTYSDVKHNTGIPDSNFTERYLKRMP